jgi:DHA3 family tetracycline resistance protein-like MFS transporter
VSVRHSRAYYIYLVLSAVTAFAGTTMFTLITVYKVQTVHLDALQLVLIGTVLEASYFLCEAPTGAFADTFSRRLSVILGIFALGAGFLLEGAIPAFAAILAGEVLAGLGFALMSGAEQAWIADEIGEDQIGAVFTRSSQIGQAAGVVATIASIALGSVALNLPILVGGALYIGLGGFLVFAMPETGFKPTRPETTSSVQAMRQTLVAGARAVRGRPVLLAILALSAITGLASEGYDRLWEAHLLTNFGFPALGNLPPVTWFGIINIAGMILGIGGAGLARRLVDTNREQVVLRVLLGLKVLQIARVLFFAFAGDFTLALIALCSGGFLYGISGPLYDTWVTKAIEPRVRATVLSFTGQANAIAQVVGGPPVGAIGSLLSLRLALATTGLLQAPALWVYGLLLRRTTQDPAPLDGSAPPAFVAVQGDN